MWLVSPFYTSTFSFVRSFVRLSIHSYHSLIHSLTHSFSMHSFTIHSFQPFIRPFVQSTFTCLQMHVILQFICSFILSTFTFSLHSFIYPFIHSTHPLTHPPSNSKSTLHLSERPLVRFIRSFTPSFIVSILDFNITFSFTQFINCLIPSSFSRISVVHVIS